MMTKERFDMLRDEFLEKETKTLYWKQGKYSLGDDALQNFREVAAFMGLKPSEVVLTYLMKHVQSISLAVRTGQYIWDWSTKEGEGLKQRIVDVRNYLLLLAASLEEEVEANREKTKSTFPLPPCLKASQRRCD